VDFSPYFLYNINIKHQFYRKGKIYVNELKEYLRIFYVDENYTAIRLSTNWATIEKDLNELVKLL